MAEVSFWVHVAYPRHEALPRSLCAFAVGNRCALSERLSSFRLNQSKTRFLRKKDHGCGTSGGVVGGALNSQVHAKQKKVKGFSISLAVHHFAFLHCDWAKFSICLDAEAQSSHCCEGGRIQKESPKLLFVTCHT
jgi:hypothetical protein